MNLCKSIPLSFLFLFSSACALTSKGGALEPKYFTIANPPNGDASKRLSTHLALRLGEIRAAEHLNELLVFRKPTGEIGFYDERRWTEKPQAYVRRAFTTAFFENGGIRQVLDNSAPTLDIELIDFAEIQGPKPAVRVEMSAVLRDDESVQFQRTFRVTRLLPATKKDAPLQPTVIVKALSNSLQEIVESVTRAVTSELTQLAQAK